MAILFGRVSNITRESGGSAIKAAAYRSCSNLSLTTSDKTTNITAALTWDYSKKKGLAYSQIHAPENAPGWIYDRQSLWQRIEDVETKQNARLAGEYTLALPKEFTVEQNIALIKEFAEEVFVSRGIVVDVNFHNDNPNNPHAHFMYVLRELVEKLGGEIDFSSYRCRALQAKAFLEGVIKEVHCRLQNIHLEKNGFEQRLEWGVAKGQEATIHHGGFKEVIAKNEQIIFRNAEKIIADPTIVIEKLDFNKAVFSKEDIEKELEKALVTTIKNIPVNDKSALDIYIKNELIGLLDMVLLSPKLTLINPCDLKGRMLFAKTEQVELEKRFIKNIEDLATKSDHVLSIKEEDIAPYAKGQEFSAQQKQVIKKICTGGNLSVLEGYPGAGKSTVTKEIARHYQEAGYKIIAAAPTNKAAQELESKLGVKVYTTSALRMKWQYDRGAEKVSIGLPSDYYKHSLYDLKEGAMNNKTLLILDEASMLDVATSDYFVSEVLKSGAKLIALGDNNQNQAIGAKGAFARMGEVGNHNILTEVNRHQNLDEAIKDQHMEATSALCNYNISKAISIYEQLGKINILESEEEKEADIVRSYIAKVIDIADKKSINVSKAAKEVVISAYTNAEISRLNNSIRESLKSAGALTKGALFRSGGIHGKSSMVELSVGDRIIFTSNLREKDGVGGVLNNELATISRIISVDNMGRGEFLVDAEGASGVRKALIRTGEEGRIVTFKHGYAVTNHAVQGASVPYKLYSVDQYNGYSSFLVGLTRHKIDCEIFAAKSTLENEVLKTKDLDVEKVREEYRATAYRYVQKIDEEGKKTYEQVDVPLWKIGLHLLASKLNDMSFAIDSSYGSASIELQKTYNAYSEQLEGMRKDLNIHEAALAKYELLANTAISLKDIKGINFLKIKSDIKNKKELTGFELNVSQHFNLKENIVVDVADILTDSAKFTIENVVKIEDHIASLKNGIISNGTYSPLNWSDLSKDDQNIVLWSYIDKEEKEELTNHYNKVRNLGAEIQDKAASLSGIWKELKASGYEKQERLDGNYKVVKEYLASRVRVMESYKQAEILNNRLISGRIQKLLIEEIEQKYEIKLKFIATNTNAIKKAKNSFTTQKETNDTELASNNGDKGKSLEESRHLYLQSIKKEGFESIIANSNLFVVDVIESAKEGSELKKLGEEIESNSKELTAAKEECKKQANIIVNNWNGHVDGKAAKDQPSFRKIVPALNINYHTLVKHAGLHEEKHYFAKLSEGSLGKNTDYHDLMYSIYKVQEKELTTSEIITLIKAHDGLCEYVETVSEYIGELKQQRIFLEKDISKDKIKVKEIEAYQSTEFPNFLGTIYEENSKSIKKTLDDLLKKTEDKKQLSVLIGTNPEMLGKVKAQGLFSRIFNSREKQIVDGNLRQLGERVKRYTETAKEMQEIQQVREKIFVAELARIDKELSALRLSLPNFHEISILEEMGKLQDFVFHGGNYDQNIATFTKKINQLLASDKAQDALFTYQTKQNLFFVKEEEISTIKTEHNVNNSKVDVELNKVIEEVKESSTTVGLNLEKSHDALLQLKSKSDIVFFFDYVFSNFTERLDLYSSKELYKDTFLSIIDKSGIDLVGIQDEISVIHDIVDEIQEEYQKLQKEYDKNHLIQGGELTEKEKLAYDIKRDISVLHQLHLGANQLTEKHTNHIEDTVNKEVDKLENFADSDKQRAADAAYKIINNQEWKKELDQLNRINNKLDNVASKELTEVEFSKMDEVAISEKELTEKESAQKANKSSDIVSINKYRSQRKEAASLKKSLQRRFEHRNQEKRFKYSWDEVRRDLSSSDVERIFYNYVRAHNANDKIERKRNELICDSLHMSLTGSKLGLWKRFSTGEGGDIFQFVQEATGCSKLESLKIVASYTGTSEIKHNFKRREKEDVATQENQCNYKSYDDRDVKEIVSWIAKPIVPDFAKEFKPKNDLAFIFEQNNSTITNIYEYRNANNQLLGYTVRIVDQDGKKQVKPVAYCFDENKISKKEGWMLKGFTDNGNKPIYGLEKLAMNSEKPVLIVEGEKTADAATKLFPDHNVISWMGGAQGVGRVKWSHLKEKLVTIWGDNDEVGANAAKNIANYIDQRNGFAGLVSVVDTGKLQLPEKWDLADPIPQESKIHNINLSKFIEEERAKNLTVGSILEKNYNELLQSESKKSLLYFIDYLVVKEGVELDHHISKIIYNDTITAMAKAQNTDITKIENHEEMYAAVETLQVEYQKLHREYDENHLQRSLNNAPEKEKLAYNIKRDISVVHQLHLGANQLTQTHMDHIEKTVKKEVDSALRFTDQITDSKKQEVADAAYKRINSQEWRKELDQMNAEKTSDIKLRFTAKSIDEFLVDKQEARATLEHIRKYEIDEKPILTIFKTDNITAGMEKLQEVSEKLTIASGFAEANKEMVNKAREFGYEKDHKDIVKSLVGMNEKEAHTYLDKDIELHHINTTLTGFEHNKQRAKTVDDILNTITEEQEFLSGLHNNIKYPEENTGLPERCKLAHAQKEDKDLYSLKSIVYQSLATGVKTEKELVSELSQAGDLKSTSKKLDKEIELHHINSTLQNLAKQKEEVETVEKMAGLLYKEAKFLSEYSNHMRHNDHSPELMKQIEYAKIAHENNHIKSLLETTNFGYQRDIFDRNEILKHYKSQGSIRDIDEHLSKICQNHNKNIIVNHMNKMKEEGCVKHDGHEFECPIKYLEHWKNNIDHKFLPIAQIEHRIAQEHKYQMQLSHTMSM